MDSSKVYTEYEPDILLNSRDRRPKDVYKRHERVKRNRGKRGGKKQKIKARHAISFHQFVLSLHAHGGSAKGSEGWYLSRRRGRGHDFAAPPVPCGLSPSFASSDRPPRCIQNLAHPPMTLFTLSVASDARRRRSSLFRVSSASRTISRLLRLKRSMATNGLSSRPLPLPLMLSTEQLTTR